MSRASIIETIERIRREDSDFITPDTIVAHTSCTLQEAHEAIVEVFGVEWMARQVASVIESTDGRVIRAYVVVTVPREDHTGPTGYVAHVNVSGESVGFGEGDTRYEAACAALSEVPMGDEGEGG